MFVLTFKELNHPHISVFVYISETATQLEWTAVFLHVKVYWFINLSSYNKDSVTLCNNGRESLIS